MVKGFPDVIDVEEYESVCERTEGLNPEATTRMAALLTNEEQVGRKYFLTNVLATDFNKKYTTF